MVEKPTEFESERAEAKNGAKLGVNRRTFAKGTGAGLALASLGAFGGNVAAQEEEDEDDNGVDDEAEEMNGLDTQFREMEREMYVAALAGEDADTEGTGVAVFLPEEGMEAPGMGDGDAPDAEEEAPDVEDEEDEEDEEENAGEDDDEFGFDFDEDVGQAGEDGSGAGNQSHSLQYHVFLMNVDDPAEITLNEGAEGEDGEVVETLVDFTQETNGADEDADEDGDDEDADDEASDEDADEEDAEEVEAEQQGVSGTIEEPIVVTGVIGANGDSEDDEDDENGELDIQDFKQNPWEYHIAVRGGEAGEEEDEEAEAEDEPEEDQDPEDEAEGDENDVEGDVLLRGQVTTGLLAGEDDLEDRVDDEEDEEAEEEEEDEETDDEETDDEETEDEEEDEGEDEETEDEETEDENE